MFGAIDGSILMSLYEMDLMRILGAFPEEMRAGWTRWDSPHMIYTIKHMRGELENVRDSREDSLDF